MGGLGAPCSSSSECDSTSILVCDGSYCKGMGPSIPSPNSLRGIAPRSPVSHSLRSTAPRSPVLSLIISS